MKGNTNTSYGMLLDGSYTFIDYADASFTKSVANDLVSIVATILDLDGNTWNLKYDEPGETVAVDNITTATKAVKTIENGQVVIITTALSAISSVRPYNNRRHRA